MSEALRARRRIRQSSSAQDLEHTVVVDTEKSKDYRSPFSVVFSANPSALWNSAQETFSSIQPPSFGTYSESESEVPVLSAPPTILFVMPQRDRTSEFATIAKSCQLRVQVNPPSKRDAINQSVQFNTRAKKIGRDLSHTCAKMEKLAEMARNKSLFDERSEVEQLSRIIKEDMTNLNNQIAELQQITRSSNTHGQTQGHSQLVVVGLQSKLANVSNDFRSVLEMRTENLKKQKNRREKFSQADPVLTSFPSSSSTPNVRSRLLQDDQDGASAVALDMGTLNQHRTQAQLTLHDQSTSYAQSRSTAMETIESSISELGQIFSQLAHLVTEQGEMITRIDSNVEETSLNVDAAHSELVKYFHNISQNRWLMIKVFGVLIAFFVFFVVFLS